MNSVMTGQKNQGICICTRLLRITIVTPVVHRRPSNERQLTFAGLAPGPFAGLVLADNGASVTRIDRPSAGPSSDVLSRGKRSLVVDSKRESGRRLLEEMIARADVLIDPFRPGVLERLGLGPELFFGDGKGKKGLNEKLIYARIVGFPRTGPHKDMAGHDINYIALSGAMAMLPGEGKPTFPLNLLADFGGGGVICALGILLALVERGRTGKGQVVNADMVSGTRYIASFPLIQSFIGSGPLAGERGTNLLDGGAPFYNTYTCKDGGWMTVGCLEPQFFAVFIDKFVQALRAESFDPLRGWHPDASAQFDSDMWPQMNEYLTKGFLTHPRDFWAQLFHGTDACAVPVLTPQEAAKLAAASIPTPHPEISAQRSVPPDVFESKKVILTPGKHTQEVLKGYGLSEERVRALEAEVNSINLAASGKAIFVGWGHVSGVQLAPPILHRMASKQLKQISRSEVEKHNTPEDLWVIIDAEVYDLSRFKAMHPGGLSVLLDPEIAGQDATEAFFSLHRQEVLTKPQYQRLKVGIIEGEKPQIHGRIAGELSKVPYSEPTWLAHGYHSPYYTDRHRVFQKAVRKFFDEVVYYDAIDREADGKRPSQSVIDKMAEIEMHAMRLGPGKHLQGRVLMNGLVTPEEFDYFHELIITQEFARSSLRGYGDGLLGGKVIGLPPVLNFGSDAIKAKVLPEVLSGKKFICLAISEAHAGSDVMGLQTTAVKSEDGKEWIINGSKKWITNGTFADYFTVGCKTEDGFTVILVERGPGVETKPIKTSYSSTAGTAYITFDNVRVPVENTLGEEGGGIFVMLSNFNHERWVMCCSSAQSQRGISQSIFILLYFDDINTQCYHTVEECLKWTTQRKVFGKPLHSQAVIRSKLAGMISRAEAVQSWLENITYQMCNMSYKQQAGKLAGQIALLKSFSTSCGQDTARDAVQVFGGRGITQTGMGKYIEHYYRTIPFDALLGGAEDVLADLGVRQALRQMPKNAKL
ncbi:hypothetical protein D9619_004961 [Psilocybe cf. subviscida]|uniref:Cytochrome b5 heme-binding domain-containing protein n=1 Tax=Psilocybe cf. subviscida TaxID=2480587 RepID=A0A8H5BRE0_9AGAR|nr:hypothetical protein D9619_004961 [Psilocybe cf. subviscida]